MIEHRPGILVFEVIGSKAQEVFGGEGGGIRFQRIPPSEKRGRVQTSTVTVAVMREPAAHLFRLDPKDRSLEWRTCRGSGKGGQHRNKTDSAVQLTHLPTKTMVRVESERSQLQNKETALALLRARLLERQQNAELQNQNASRKAQVGCGARGDKRRTVRERDDQVTDHMTGKRTTYGRYLQGFLEDLA